MLPYSYCELIFLLNNFAVGLSLKGHGVWTVNLVSGRITTCLLLCLTVAVTIIHVTFNSHCVQSCTVFCRHFIHRQFFVTDPCFHKSRTHVISSACISGYAYYCTIQTASCCKVKTNDVGLRNCFCCSNDLNTLKHVLLYVRHMVHSLERYSWSKLGPVLLMCLDCHGTCPAGDVK